MSQIANEVREQIHDLESQVPRDAGEFEVREAQIRALREKWEASKNEGKI